MGENFYNKNLLKKRIGGLITLPTIVFLCLLIIAIVISMMSSGFLEGLLSQAVVQSHQGFYLADSGIDDALLKIARNKNLVENTSLTWRLPVSQRGQSLVTISSITSTELLIFSSGDIFDKLKYLKTNAFLNEYGKITSTIWKEQTKFWYDSGWNYRKMIALNYHQVESNLVNFPVLISITDNDLKSKAKSDGSDILFTGFDGITKLPREIEKWDSSTGTLVAWVKVPFLSSYAPTIIYLYYGNANASETNSYNVWDSNFKGVWHLKETSGTHYDSSSNGNNGTPYNGVVQGTTAKIAGGDSFDGSDDYIEIPHSDSLNISGAVSMEAWVYPYEVGTQRWQGIMAKGGGAGGYAYGINFYGTTNFQLLSSNGIRNFGNPQDIIPQDQWTHIVGILTSEGVKLYKNGNLFNTMSGVSPAQNTIIFAIARSGTSSEYFKGLIDEVRISNTVRSDAWIKTEYNNQSDPSNFYYFIGNEESY